MNMSATLHYRGMLLQSHAAAAKAAIGTISDNILRQQLSCDETLRRQIVHSPTFVYFS